MALFRLFSLFKRMEKISQKMVYFSFLGYFIKILTGVNKVNVDIV